MIIKFTNSVIYFILIKIMEVHAINLDVFMAFILAKDPISRLSWYFTDLSPDRGTSAYLIGNV